MRTTIKTKKMRRSRTRSRPRTTVQRKAAAVTAQMRANRHPDRVASKCRDAEQEKSFGQGEKMEMNVFRRERILECSKI